MMNPKKILKIIKESLPLISEIKNEKQIQNILSTQLNCSPRQTLTSSEYPNIEVDVFTNNTSIETKFNSEYYKGDQRAYCHYEKQFLARSFF